MSPARSHMESSRKGIGQVSTLASRGRFSYKPPRMTVKRSQHGPASRGKFDLSDFLARSSIAVDAALDRFLPAETVKPATLHKAMRYSLFAGGKRIRPALCLAAAAACGGKVPDAMPLACALECIHSYSLIH